MSPHVQDDFSDLDFASTMRDVTRGLIVKPLLLNYLRTAPKLHIPTVRNDMAARPPDGWFHPSSHPVQSDSALYWYLAEPARMVLEELNFESRMSVTWGTAMHVFFQPILEKIGLAPAELNRCTTCPQGRCPSGGKEPGFISEELRSRTHADKVLVVPLRPRPVLCELKTGQDNTWVSYERLKKLRDLDNEAFRHAYPGYYAQAQNVQMISGYDETILVMIAWGYPWAMREFHLKADPEFQAQLGGKYRRVLDAVEARRPPRCLCSSKAATECPARGVCGR